jgi:transcriptional regulator with XRE-family HTH domain
MEIKNLIGKRILELRKDKGLSQEALANLAEVDRTYLTGVETGKRNISVQVLQRIIKALETSFKDFFCHEDFGDIR